MLDKFMLMLWRFRFDRSGVTAIEYGLIGVLIAILIIVGATTIGTNLDSTFKKIAAALVGPPETPPDP